MPGRPLTLMRGIAVRFLLPFGVLAALFATFILLRALAASRRHAEELASQQAALALEFNLAIRDYAARYIRPVAEQYIPAGRFLPEVMSSSFISRKIFEEVRKNYSNCFLRFASDNPRNPVNAASPEELRMIQYFRDHTNSGPRTEHIQINGRPYLAHFTPKWIQPECLRCHGDPTNAPADLLARYGATASFLRRVGDVAGLDTVAVPVDDIRAALASEARQQSVILIVGLALLAAAVAAVFHWAVSRRLGILASHFHASAAQPDSGRLAPVAVGGKDEIAVVGAAFNTLVGELNSNRARLEERVQERTAELARANEQLRLQMAERERAEAATRASLEEKTILLKEVHHRVKNNLQVVISLLHLQEDRGQDRPAREVLADTQNRVRSMALLHEALYRSERLSHVNLAGYVERLCTHLFRSSGADSRRVRLVIRVEPVELDLDQAIPCGLIINELMANSLKHGFPNGREGRITVDLSAQAGRVTLRVSDSGAGYPPGQNFDQPATLGLQLVASLARQLGGRAEFPPGPGAACQVVFQSKNPAAAT